MELTVDEVLKKGVDAHKAGQIQEAERLYTAILEAQPKHPDANHNMGVLAVGMGKVLESLTFFKTALEANSSIDQFWLSYITALIKLGRLADADDLFDQAKGKGASGAAFDQLEQQLAESTPSLQDPPTDQLQSLINLYTQGQLQQALSLATKMMESFPSSVVLYNVAGASNAGLMQFDAAIDNYKKALTIKPDFAEAYNNIGVTLKNKGYPQEAIESYKEALKIESEYAEAYYNMGIALNEMGDLEGAINSYRQALALEPNYDDAHKNIGLVLIENKQYQKAVGHFKSSNSKNSKYFLLKCLYMQGKKSLFYDQLDYLINQGEVHPMVGSFGCRAELKYGIARPNLFCKQPLNYVLKTNLSEKYDFEKIFVKTSKSILNEHRVKIKRQALLINGYQTSGNIFILKNDLTEEIQQIIRLEIKNYLASFKDSEEGLITSWPSDYSLDGWLVNMKSGGELKPHMHESGWISGSIYIKVPSKLTDDSGNLVVCIGEDRLGDEGKQQEKNINVVTGNLCLFPSSLLHYTIPFESEEERIVLAFDVVPTY